MLSRARASLRQVLFLASLATALTVFFVFLGGPVLRVLYNLSGLARYVLTMVVFCAPLFFTGLETLGFFSIGIWLVVGIYGWLESRGLTGFWWATLAVMIGTFVSALGPMIYLGSQDAGAYAELESSVAQFMKTWKGSSPNGLTEEDLKVISELTIQLLPGMLGILMISVLGVALIFADRIAVLMGLRYEKIASEMKLLEFKVPDVLIWITMLSFLLSIVKVGGPAVQVVSLNVFILCMGVYFFQGLAVMESGFSTIRLHFLIRFFVYVFVVAQLFFLLSILGFADFWIDFRKRWKAFNERLSKRSEE